MDVPLGIHKANPSKVCFKKTVTIHSTASLLWIVTFFLKQTLVSNLQAIAQPFDEIVLSHFPHLVP